MHVFRLLSTFCIFIFPMIQAKMSMLHSTCEIVESTEELSSQSKMNEYAGKQSASEIGKKYSIEDDINSLFQAIEIRNSARNSGLSREAGKDPLRKSAMKRPIRVSSSQALGIGISEPVSLKQALRGLCISQASEMAAMKRLSKPSGSSGVSEAGTIKRLYKAVVAEANGSGLPMSEGKGNFVEISLVPDTLKLSEKIGESVSLTRAELSNPKAQPSTAMANALTPEAPMANSPPEDHDEIIPLPTKKSEIHGIRKLESADSSLIAHANGKSVLADEVASTSIEVPKNSPNSEKGQKGKLQYTASLSGSCTGSKGSKSFCSSPRLIKPIFKNRNFLKNKVKEDSSCASSSSTLHDGNIENDLNPCASNLENQTQNCNPKHEMEEHEKASPVSGSTNISIEVNSTTVDTNSSKPDINLNCSNGTKSLVRKVDERSRSREKGEFSQSSKSSIGDYSSCTSTSEESSLSGSSRSGKRPHMSKDLRWEAIHHIQKKHGSLGLRHFKLLRRLGCGDIGTVYLAELTGTNCLFALKVMDNEFLVTRKKMLRAQTEREILQMLDHPFLPTLFAHFVSDKLSCLVMEYCPGGDLHVLRQKQPTRSFSEQAARYLNFSSFHFSYLTE